MVSSILVWRGVKYLIGVVSSICVVWCQVFVCDMVSSICVVWCQILVWYGGDMWPEPAPLMDKLYGNPGELRRTAAFVQATGIFI